MLPTRQERQLLEVLTDLETRVRVKTNVRVGLADGSEIQGSLIGASPEHIAIAATRATAARRIPSSEIRRILVAGPHRQREWALAGIGIVGAVAALVGITSVPVIGPSLRVHAQDAFRGVFATGTVLLGFLLARTGLRPWLTQWRVVYEGDQYRV